MRSMTTSSSASATAAPEMMVALSAGFGVVTVRRRKKSVSLSFFWKRKRLHWDRGRLLSSSLACAGKVVVFFTVLWRYELSYSGMKLCEEVWIFLPRHDISYSLQVLCLVRVCLLAVFLTVLWRHEIFLPRYENVYPGTSFLSHGPIIS
jgi:hypothetical protein